MLNIFKKKELFLAPISGEIIQIEQVNDPVFSQKMMGDGFGIIPSDKTVYAPMSGTISVCFPTNHAVGIKTDNGREFLIHIGINTVELKEKVFQSFVTQGQKIKQGDKLIEIDLDLLHSLKYDSTVIIVFPNSIIEMKELNKAIEHHELISMKF